MSIVVGTDFSKSAEEAVKAAHALSRKLSLPLLVAHVAEPSILDRVPGKGRDGLRAELRAGLEALVARLRAAGGQVEARPLEGSPDEQLAELSRGAKARLLVVGAGAQKPGRTTFLGSVAERTVRLAEVPILVVRDASPFVAWALNGHRLRVTVGDDLSRLSEVAVRYLGELRSVNPVEPILVHLYSPYSDLGRIGLYRTREGTEEVERGVERELEERAAALGLEGGRARVAMHDGRVAGPLTAIAAAEKSDLLLLGTHGRGNLSRIWHSSVSHDVLHLSPCSVALVPLPVEAPPVMAPLPRIRKVLAATDFSPLGNLTVPYAYSVLREGGEVVLFHVEEMPVPYVYGDLLMMSALAAPPRPTEDVELRRQLEAIPPPEVRGLGIKTTFEVESAVVVADAICQAAERHGVDLICVASHGRTAAKRAVMGSVTRRVMQQSQKPVLVVRAPPLR